MIQFPFEYRLAEPIPVQRDGRTITIDFVAIQRPKGKHLRAMDRKSGEMAKTLVLVGVCCGLADSEVDELSTEDVIGIGKVIAGENPLDSPAPTI